MQLTYQQRQTYQILCNTSGLVGVCYLVTIIDVYGDNVYLSSSTSSQEIPLAKMQVIVSQLKVQQ